MKTIPLATIPLATIIAEASPLPWDVETGPEHQGRDCAKELANRRLVCHATVHLPILITLLEDLRDEGECRCTDRETGGPAKGGDRDTVICAHCGAEHGLEAAKNVPIQ